MTAKIARIDIHQLLLPLIKPYRLSFGTQHAFETLLVIVTDGDGRSGFGEATMLPGYTDETIAQGWETATAVAPTLTGLDFDAARATLVSLRGPSAFTATAFLTALDMLDEHAALKTPGRVELLAILSSDGSDEGAARDEIDAFVEQGYGTLKFKVGFDVERDLAALRTIQKAADGRARIRVDANQGFSAAQAITFLEGIDPDHIELLEQPCDKDDWQAAATVRPHHTVPLMLDESIYGIVDIERAAADDLADYIKLKLMKLGDITSLTAALDLIAERGMTPVLGNGVAGDLGCWMECCAAPGHIANAGEMNGFLKTRLQLLDPPLRMEGACVVLPGTMPRLNAETVNEASVGFFTC